MSSSSSSSSSAAAAAAAAASPAECVQVVVRLRPSNAEERRLAAASAAGPPPTCVRIDGAHGEVVIDNADMSNTKVPRVKKFTFDRAFDAAASQQRLFDTSVAPVVEEALRGYSCCIFAYGQTGTGKTYTMEGPRGADGAFDAESEHAGIIPRTVKRVFAALDARGDGFEYVVKMSFLEIYNERLDDLLSPDPCERRKRARAHAHTRVDTRTKHARAAHARTHCARTAGTP